MNSASEYNRQAVELKRKGQFQAAIACYEAALRLQPDFAESHFNLGILWRDLGRIAQALRCLQAAAALRPDVSAIHCELANVLVLAGETEAAIGHLRQALAMTPGDARAAFNLGALLADQRRWSDAEQAFRASLRSAPGDPDTWTSLGTVLRALGRFADAAAACQQALMIQPDHAVAWVNLGNVRKNQGQLTEAIHCYQRAQAAAPQLAAAATNLGNAWLECGEFMAAWEQYQRAACQRPDDPRSHVDLGNVLQRLGKTTDAVQAYERALQLDGDCLDARLNLGHLRRERGDVEQATGIYRELALRQPSDPLHRLRVAASCPLVFRDRAELESYRAELVDVTHSVAGSTWSLDFDRFTVYAPECPYNLQFLDGNLRSEKEAFARVFARYFDQHARRERVAIPVRDRPRVGFVVTARHESAFLRLLAGVVRRLDQRRWEPVVLCSRLGVDKMRAGFPGQEIAIIPFPERFDHIVHTIQDARCDLLYYWEVGNDPTNYFLPFLRLARVQVTSWGIQVTSGITSLDAYLSSELVEIPNAQEHYTERLIRASTLLTYQQPLELGSATWDRAEWGFGTQTRVYGCLQNLGKFHPDFDSMLAEILRRDPLGVLVLLRDAHGFAADRLHARFRRTMPDVAARVLFCPPQDHHAYVAMLAACDVLLDPLHFGGVTTTYDALALAQPVVTLPTEFHRGRYTAACLRMAGVTETIARDAADYVNLAVELANNRDRKQEVIERLEAGRDAVFEDQAAVREHERIFHELLTANR